MPSVVALGLGARSAVGPWWCPNTGGMPPREPATSTPPAGARPRLSWTRKRAGVPLGPPRTA
eukprot:10574557-Lingulodinium_polyedra.AAC.1